MANIVRFAAGTYDEWMAAGNPRIPNRMPVMEEYDDGSDPRFKIGKIDPLGDGTTCLRYSDLNYASIGAQGVQGIKGDTTSIRDLMGTSATTVTLPDSGEITLTINDSNAASKAWMESQWVKVSAAGTDVYGIFKVVSYNNSTFALRLAVEQTPSGGTQVPHSSWIVTPQLAGVLADHVSSHLPNGSDPLPMASDLTDGFMSADNYKKLSRFEIEGASMGYELPYMIDEEVGSPTFGQRIPSLPAGSIFFLSSVVSAKAPAVTQIYDRYVIAGNIVDGNAEDLVIPFRVVDEDLLNINADVVSSTGRNPIPKTKMTVVYDGVSGEGIIRIKNEDLNIDGESAVQLMIQNSSALSTDVIFNIFVTAQAYTITLTHGANGTFYPDVTELLVGAGSTRVIETRPTLGFAANTFSIDGQPAVKTSTGIHSFTNIQKDYSIHATFAEGVNVNLVAGANGTASKPTGSNLVIIGDPFSVTFFGDTGAKEYMPTDVKVDTFSYPMGYGVVPVAKVNGGVDTITVTTDSVVVTAATSSHTIEPIFGLITYKLTWNLAGTPHGGFKAVGAASSSTTGQITGIASGDRGSFVVVPDTDYEIYDVHIDGLDPLDMSGNVVNVIGLKTATELITPVMNADKVLTATFRIQAPQTITPTVALGASEELVVTWTHSTSNQARSATYEVYYKENATTAVPANFTGWTKFNGSITGTTTKSATLQIANGNGKTYGVVVVAINSTAPTGVWGAAVQGTPSDNVAPTSTITASLPTVTSASAVKLVTDGSATGSVVWEYVLPTASKSLFECDFYDSGESNLSVGAVIYGDALASHLSAASVYMVTTGSTTQYRATCTSAGSLYYGTRTTGWHHMAIDVTGDSNAKVYIDGILCYQGLLCAAGINSGTNLTDTGIKAVRLQVSTNSSNAVAKTGYFTNVKYNSTDISVATQGSWNSITALGTTTWGV